MSVQEPADEMPVASEVDVLIVEDSLTQAMKLQHILERHRHRVTTARNGEEALAALAPGGALPRIVITDINMPRMDGYELCARIKDDARLREIPVILLTSLSDPKDILKGLECGADNFIVKPYDEEFLLSRIQYVLANLELRQQSGERRHGDFFRRAQIPADFRADPLHRPAAFDLRNRGAKKPRAEQGEGNARSPSRGAARKKRANGS